ncbi:MAG: MAPEG family protein [Burkholderiaceae bacterium]|jgi:uncharacterized MAPEG superfamily protein
MTPHFTVAHWCVLVAALLPIACAGLAKWGMFKTPRRNGGYDNHNPRAWLANQGDWRARANAAQANSFEALPFFIGAVVIAHQLHAPQTRLDILALLFVVTRVIYIFMYVADLATARSLAWTVALALNIAILFSGG